MQFPQQPFARTAMRLTDSAVLTMLMAASGAAAAMTQPQCIAIVDCSGVILAQLRMDGAKFLSLHSALAKADTAASINAPSHTVSGTAAATIAAATGGRMTALPGGLPIRLAGELVGGIGVGSGTSRQDVLVALAALRAIGAELFEELP